MAGYEVPCCISVLSLCSCQLKRETQGGPAGEGGSQFAGNVTKVCPATVRAELGLNVLVHVYGSNQEKSRESTNCFFLLSSLKVQPVYDG